MFSNILHQLPDSFTPAIIKPTLLSLPVEIREKIEDLLDPDTRYIYGKALTDLTKNKRAASSPARELHLLSHLLQRISPKFRQLERQILLARIPELEKFVFDQFCALFEEKLNQFHQIVQIPALFNLLSLVRDPKLLNYLAERVQQLPVLQQELLRWVERSKTDLQVHIQAANALTLLVRTGVPLSGMNFRGIHVSGADLSYGLFDGTQFQGADLSRVNLQGAWLRNANFEEANLANAHFGVMPLSKTNIAPHQVAPSILRFILEDSNDEVSACSKDGKWLISGSDKAVKLWSVTVNPPRLHHEFNSNRHLALAFSPDSKWLALSGRNGHVELWSIETSIPIQRHLLQDEYFQAYHIVFSPNSEQLALSNNGHDVKLWSLKDDLPKLNHTFNGYAALGDIPFSPDGKWLALSKANGCIELWSFAAEQPVLQHVVREPKEHSKPLHLVSFSPDGKWLISSSDHFTVEVWLIESAPFMLWQTWHIDLALYSKVVTSPDTQWITALFGNSHSANYSLLKPWATEIDPSVSWRVPAGYASSIKSMALSRDGKRLAVHSGDRTIKLWSIKTEVPIFQATLELGPPSEAIERFSSENFSNITFSEDGNWLALADGKTINLWNLKESSFKDPKFRLTGHTDSVTSLAFSPDSKYLVSGSKDKSAKLWPLDAPKPTIHRTLSESTAHYAKIYSVTFSADGKWIALGDGDHGLELFSLKTGPLKKYRFKIGGFSQDSDPVSFCSMSFSPDGKRLAVGRDDGIINLWSIKPNLAEREYPDAYLDANPDGVHSVSFSPDGKWLASGGHGKARIWSTDLKKCLAEIEGFTRQDLLSVGWSKTHEGEVLLTTSGSDQAIRCWKVKQIDNDHCDVRLHWTSHQTMFTAAGASISGVQGLSPDNTQLLIESGAQETAALVSNILNLS